MSNIHVVPNGDGGWSVKEETTARVLYTSETKEKAVDMARKFSKNERTELIIHSMEGKIQSKDSHGNDPYPPGG